MRVRNFQVVVFVGWSQGQVRLYLHIFCLIKHAVTNSVSNFYSAPSRMMLLRIPFGYA